MKHIILRDGKEEKRTTVEDVCRRYIDMDAEYLESPEMIIEAGVLWHVFGMVRKNPAKNVLFGPVPREVDKPVEDDHLIYKCENGHYFVEPKDAGYCSMTECAGHEVCPTCRSESMKLYEIREYNDD